jgi:hypothetical protein
MYLEGLLRGNISAKQALVSIRLCVTYIKVNNNESNAELKS